MATEEGSTLKITEVLQAGQVTRYHAAPIDRKQTIAEHTFGVLAIIYELEPHPSPNLIKAAVFHDVAEIATGDIPAPVKKANLHIKKVFDELEDVALKDMGVTMPDLTDHEQWLLKVADCLEGMHYCDMRIRAGDLGAIEVRDRYITYLNKLGYEL